MESATSAVTGSETALVDAAAAAAAEVEAYSNAPDWSFWEALTTSFMTIFEFFPVIVGGAFAVSMSAIAVVAFFALVMVSSTALVEGSTTLREAIRDQMAKRQLNIQKCRRATEREAKSLRSLE